LMPHSQTLLLMPQAQLPLLLALPLMAQMP
jgi:hypothetical protein